MTPKEEGFFYAIDPGDVHVGVARFDGETCTWARESDPTSAMHDLAKQLPGAHVLVVERYQLYPHLAQLQQGSDMRTSQMIGALKWLAWTLGIPVVIQQAALKKPTEALIRHRGVQRVAQGDGDHAFDAETHGYTYLWKNVSNARADAIQRSQTDIFGS